MFVFELLFCISTTICFVLLSILFFLREDKYSDQIHLIPSSFRAYSYLYLNGAGLLFPVPCMPRKNCIQIRLSSSLLSSSLSLICSLATPIIFKKPVIYYQFPTFFNPHWFLTALWLGFYTLFICSNHLSHLCLKPLVFLVGVQPTFNTNILQLSSSALFPPSVLGNPLLLTPLHCALIFKLRKMYLPSFFFS